MADYNDGGEGAGPEGYAPEEEDYGPEAQAEEAWSGDDAQKAWEDHLDEGDPDHYGDYGYTEGAPYSGPSAGTPSAATAEQWRQQDEAKQRYKECAGKPEEYRGPCEAAAEGKQFPMGDEPMRYNAPATGRSQRAPITGMR